MTILSRHLATVWEAVADTYPDRSAAIDFSTGEKRAWSDFDQRSARLAASLSVSGIGPGGKVALLLPNCVEYLETQFAALKQRCCVINVNYRYTADELVYLLTDSDSEALVFESRFAPVVRQALQKTQRLKLIVEVTRGGQGVQLPGALDYEGLITAVKPASRIERDEEDVYMIYTGGTTGMPKGVMHSMRDQFTAIANCARILGADEVPLTPEAVLETAAELTRKDCVPDNLPAAPLMHGTGGHVGAQSALLFGGCVLLSGDTSLDAELHVRAIASHGVRNLVVVGDAMVQPLLSCLDRIRQEEGSVPDLSSLRLVLSAGAAWSLKSKLRLLEYVDADLFEVLGSSETVLGSSLVNRDNLQEGGVFNPAPGVKVFNATWEEVEAGSGETGMLASPGRVPLGYYKAPAKSAETFRDIGGTRYTISGDYAQVDASGRLIFLGRGSSIINSGGEKIFAEEVEAVIKQLPDVEDCLVLGVPDERFGSKVAALIARSRVDSVDDERVTGWCRQKLAGYKVPREISFVPVIQRFENGKADYGWAREVLGVV